MKNNAYTDLVIMKKTIAIALILCILLAVPAYAAADASPFVGNWKIYAMEGDMPVPHEQLAGTFMDSIAATLREDGTLSINLLGELVEDVWTDNGDGTGIFNANGYSCPMTVQDGFLRIDMGAGIANSFYVFEKSAQSAEALAGSTATDWAAVENEYGYHMPEQVKSDSLLVGEWRFYSSESGDPEQNIPHEKLPELKEQGRDYAGDWTLQIGDDGWFKITDFNGFEQNTWTDTGDSRGKLNANGQDCTISIEDGLLVLRASDSVTRYEKTVAVGTTGCLVAVPADYAEGEVTEAEKKDDQIAYYRSEKHLMDFDVYQFPAEGQTLADYAAKEAKEYGADEVKNIEINGVPLALYYSEEKYDGTSYRVANYLFAAGEDFGELSFWLDGEDAEALSEQIISSLSMKKLPQEDLYGEILKKLPGDFIDVYQVRVDDGTLYEAEYIGFEDLEPGTAVILSQWGGRDWTIELKDASSRPHSKPQIPAGVYTTADGIVIDELSVHLAGGQTWGFGYALHNPGDKTVYFDPSPFVLKTADGTEIKTAASYVSADEVWAGNVTRVSTTIMSPELVHLGDEISFWYDGSFLGTVIAQEF